jgi:hypothetical protein
MNEYLKAWGIATEFINAKINPDSPGGVEAQLDQLYGNARLVMTALAEQTKDSTFYSFINLIRKARGDN